jgi:predicted O-linked N-acetylglucosamine transferase (SPINDLY family)
MLKNLFNKLRPATPAATPPATPTPAADAPPPVRDDVPAADALVDDGNAREDAGDAAAAEALYRAAVAKAPGHARGHLNLGIALAARGDVDGAAAAYERVLAIDPRHPFGHYNFARLAFLGGDHARAEALLRTALEARPEFPQALVLQASVLDAQGRTAPAIEALESALRLQPDNPGIWLNQALLLMKARRIDDAETAARTALRLGGPDPEVLALLSRLLSEHGFADEALVPLREAIALRPDARVHRANELLLLNMVDDISADEMFRRHAALGRELEAAFPVRFPDAPRAPDPQRRLRVGYVSGDFHVHPVTNFILPVLEHHDRAQVEVVAYSSGSTIDHVTGWVRERCDRWVDARGLTDDQLADAIHADGIDVLVDLSGHTKDARLGTFCQRPAPVQVSWLGYLNTTGLTRIDWRLCDARTDPIAVSQPFHTERLAHLPDSQWCYRPFLPTPVSPEAPLERNGFVTFGSFNSALKITSPAVRRWGRAMARLPGSRLRVADIKSERKRAAIRADLEREGVSADRVAFVPRVDVDKYLELFSAVDVAFDTFPYGGGTTTLDALWMGVPVLATTGATPVSRSAASILQLIGLGDWVAPSVDAFADVAVARASDIAAVVALRRSLRERMQASPLTDEVRFTRGLEAVYRQMWRTRLARSD